MSWQVQHRTICDGWVNCWSVCEANGSSTPETFATREAAEAALAQFLAEIEEEIAFGHRQPDEGHDPADYRIAPADPP